jgi:hypothetical protein
VGKSKTGQEGEGAEIAIPRAYRLRSVEAVQVWLAAAELTEGPLFRPVLKGGRIQSEPLTAFSVALIVKHCAARAGLDSAVFAGHSLRSGFLTSAAEAGASPGRIPFATRLRPKRPVTNPEERALRTYSSGSVVNNRG